MGSQRRGWTKRAAAFAASGMVLALSGLAGAAGSAPSTLTFTDAAGDVAGAPDLTKVAVNGDASSGTITFQVTATGLALPSADGSNRIIDLWLNTDRNDATGSPGGNEYDLFAWTESTDPAQWYWDIERYANGGWQEVAETPTMHVSGAGSDFSFQVNKSDLGGATSFSIYATSVTVDANGNDVGHDIAPDGAVWVYDITGPTRTVTTFARPTIGKAVLIPAKPIAGKRLTITFPVTMTSAGKPAEPLASGKIVGSAWVGGKAVAHASSLQGGVAKVSLVVPKGARGKAVKVAVTVTAPSSEGSGGTWVNLATGEQGLMATFVKGGSATKSVSATAH